MIVNKSPNDEVPLSSSFELVPGKYGPDDEVLLLNGRMPSMLEIAQAVAHFFKNDERIFPQSRGFEGGDKWRKFILETLFRGKVTYDMLRRYHLKYPR